MESDFARSELLEGWGQRMSGSVITYTMNTISRLAVAMTMIGLTFHITPDEVWVEFLKPEGGRFSAMISGDDCCIFTSKEDAYYLSRAYDVLNNMGMVRKDIPLLTPTPIRKRIEAMEFCSHSYQPVTYYDSTQDTRITRYMPTRSVAEIVAKASIWMGYQGNDEAELAWLTTQGVNLIMNYHHLRIPRLLGFCYRSIAPDNLILTSIGPYWKRTPWLKPGKLLDIVNEVLFGESTMYPHPGFRLTTLKHLGYIPLNQEVVYQQANRYEGGKVRQWKRKLILLTMKFAQQYGGDISYMSSTGLFEPFT